MYKICWDFGNKKEQDSSKCENKVDLAVEPYQKNDHRIQNIVGQDGVKQPYKPTSENELWTFMWPPNFVGTNCLYLIFVGIYAHSH